MTTGHHRYRLAAVYLGLLALSAGCLSTASAKNSQKQHGRNVAEGPTSLTNKIKQHHHHRRHRLGDKTKIVGLEATAAAADADAVQADDEEFWARMLQQVGGSIEPPTNQPPIANDLSAATTSSSTVSENVLANDSDPDGDPIAVLEIEGESVKRGTTITLDSGAMVTIDPKGDFTYDPQGAYDSLGADDSAQDSFEYTIADPDGATDTATVFVLISGTNSPPVANDDTFQTPNDELLRNNVLINDSDPDGDDISVIRVNGATVPTDVDLDSGAKVFMLPNGDFEYDPNGAFPDLPPGSTVEDSFTYTIADTSGATDTATVTVIVGGTNEPPVANDDSYSTMADETLRGNNVLDNDSDPDDDDLTVTFIDDIPLNGSPTTVDLFSGAEVTIRPGGLFVYRPGDAFDYLREGETATDSFEYTISDPFGESDTATVTITIVGVNNPPIANDVSIQTISKESTDGNVCSNDEDPEGGELTVTMVDGTMIDGTTPVRLDSGALVTMNPDCTFTYDPDGAFDDVAQGSTASDEFTYTISDDEGATDSADVFVTITGSANEPPVANDDSFTTAKDDTVVGNVLANDSDPEGQPLEVIMVDDTMLDDGPTDFDLDSGATVMMSPDGDFEYDPNGAFDNLANGEEAQDLFTYTIADPAGATDSAAVIITIVGTNTGPVAADDFLTTLSDTVATGNVLINDSDPDGEEIQVVEANDVSISEQTDVVLDSGAVITIGPQGNLVYDPNGVFDDLEEGEEFTDSFDYTISDPKGLTDSATVFINVIGSVKPTPAPTNNPTKAPTPVPPTPVPPTPVPPMPVPPTPVPPTPVPTANPTRAPTPGPTNSPTKAPTPRPPTPVPTTAFPTATPTFNPTLQCNLTPQERREQLTLQAIRVSGPTAPITEGTPQYNALEWLIDEDAFYVCPQDPKSVQRYVVAVFYFSTNGPNWAECSAPDDLTDPASIDAANAACDLTLTPPPLGTDIIPRISGTDAWLTPVNECFWGGLECNADDFCLDRVEFENNTLAGTLPVEVEELEDLRFFYTERGNIGGKIPDGYGTLSKLIVFDVDFNKLTGSIPSTFFDLREILQFDLNNNTLTGTLSPRIGEMTTLRFLQVGGNPLRGEIPTELGNLDLLIVGGFEYTDLTGTMPEEICDNRVPPIGDGFIRSLISDCLGPNAQLECNCCTECKR